MWGGCCFAARWTRCGLPVDGVEVHRVFRASEKRVAAVAETEAFAGDEFADLPKTISGKIRRVELRALEERRRAEGGRGTLEFWEQDFVELRRPEA